ncbi:MAG: hypothetical protein VX112_00975 [Pseudomonadota bacterium]|nr:hypothetical protein [Pseudomonadota bacterium]
MYNVEDINDAIKKIQNISNQPHTKYTTEDKEKIVLEYCKQFSINHENMHLDQLLIELQKEHDYISQSQNNSRNYKR